MGFYAHDLSRSRRANAYMERLGAIRLTTKLGLALQSPGSPLIEIPHACTPPSWSSNLSSDLKCRPRAETPEANSVLSQVCSVTYRSIEEREALNGTNEARNMAVCGEVGVAKQCTCSPALLSSQLALN